MTKTYDVHVNKDKLLERDCRPWVVRCEDGTEIEARELTFFGRVETVHVPPTDEVPVSRAYLRFQGQLLNAGDDAYVLVGP